MENILGLGINVTFSGIAIVFGMLVLLVLILILFGKVGQLFKGEEHTIQTSATRRTLTPIEKPVSKEIDGEIIAVIAAAVASMYSDTNIKPVIKSVRKAGTRPAWAAAGILDNTKPF